MQTFSGETTMFNTHPSVILCENVALKILLLPIAGFCIHLGSKHNLG